ncbi:magnesium/cobalt transporter CorA, partial [bacterium]|nr:magnesium/cobalt transporter CorA [bacterium]
IEKLGLHFGAHPMVLEDILNTGQRPKFEDFDDYCFISLKMLYYNGKQDEIIEEQLSIILGKNFVISFQERVGDVFEPVRERIRTGKIRIRKRRADHIAYALIDSVVDNYFIVLEKLGGAIEDFEELLLDAPPPEAPEIVLSHKRKIIALRRSIMPLRDAISDFYNSESELLTETTVIYLRDTHDHVIHALETIDSYREMTAGMLDTYHSSISNRMNEVMKVLTIIATIFIPLTFLAGIYGMNFEVMPELGWRWTYPIGFWTIIIGVGAFMFYFFKRKRWL